MRVMLTATFGARRPLATGSYRLAVIARDVDGNRSGPRTASFKVAR
jgi:hypothetical protein